MCIKRMQNAFDEGSSHFFLLSKLKESVQERKD